MAHSKKVPLLVAAAAAVAALSFAWSAAGRAEDRRDCFYNGQKADERLGNPEHFTGMYTCKDGDTGKVVLRQRQVDGVVEGESTRYDARTGKVEEVTHYLHGRAHGTRRQYSDGVLDFEWAYVDGRRAGVQRDMKDGALARVYLMGDGDGQVDTSLSFNKKGQLTSITCGRQAIGPRDFAWCGRDGAQSAVSLYDDQGRLRATEQYQWGRAHGLFRKLDPATGRALSEQRFDKGQSVKDGRRIYDGQGALLLKSDCDEKRSSCTETELFAGGQQPHVVTVWKSGRVVKQSSYYQNGHVQEDLERLPSGDHFSITIHHDNGKTAIRGTYMQAEDGYWRIYEPDGLVESFADDGALLGRETYRRGRLHGPAQRFWVRDDKRMREDAEYADDTLIKQKIFENGLPLEEHEYFPDGSIKSQKDHTGAAGARL
jgi:antitoxin component YwqK of YwqJK toxin-antitoxin module